MPRASLIPYREVAIPPVAERPSALLLLLLAPVLYAAPLVAAAMLPLLTAAVLWLARDQGVLGWKRDLTAGWAWLPLVVVMALSALWALDAAAALSLALRLAGLVLCGILLAGSLARLPVPVLGRLLRALGWGLLAAALVVLVDLAFGGPLTAHLHGKPMTGYPVADGYSRGSVVQAILAGPLAFGLWRFGDKRLALAQLVFGTLAVFAGAQWAAKLALCGGAAVGLLILVLPRLRIVVPVLLVGLLFGLPWAMPVQLPADATCWLADHKPSALHRVLIWNWVDARIRERPVLGWGLDAARRMPGAHDRITVRACGPDQADAPIRLTGEVLPLHPHDAVLQLWLELGGLGALAAGFGLIASLWPWFRSDAPAAPPIAAMLVTGTLVALLSFGIWQEWWLAVLILGAALSRACGRAV